MTDYDERGEKIAKELKSTLNADVDLREKLFSLIKKEVTKIEELEVFINCVDF